MWGRRGEVSTLKTNLLTDNLKTNRKKRNKIFPEYLQNCMQCIFTTGWYFCDQDAPGK